MDGEVERIVEDFPNLLYSLVNQIPEGRVTTYGKLAEALGDKRAARAVGQLLKQNPEPVEVPCHRVVRSSGNLGGYVEGKEMKAELLEAEGVEVGYKEVENFENIVFENFSSEKPLHKLREEQHEKKKLVEIEELEGEPRFVGGVDAAYGNGEGYAVLYVWDEERSKEYVSKIQSEVKFPYIPTYLAFRELPLLLEAVEKAEVRPDVVMVDGNGILHPERFGLASHLGVETDIPTLGVAKSKLCGRIKGKIAHETPTVEVEMSGERRGYALLSSERAEKPIYISPGHRIGCEESLDLVRKYCNYKVPKPVRKAHILAGKMKDKCP
ncbi:MAG: endonuclease V [Candidatus Aenigmatarchaeota archaeon]